MSRADPRAGQNVPFQTPGLGLDSRRGPSSLLHGILSVFLKPFDKIEARPEEATGWLLYLLATLGQPRLPMANRPPTIHLA